MRGQSASEYLMTYGWAILSLGVVIAAIISLMIKTPSSYVPEECTLGLNLKCNAQIYTHEGGGLEKIAMGIRNDFPYKILVKHITIKKDGREIGSADIDEEVESGETTEIEDVQIDIEGYPSKSEKLDLELVYISCAPEVNPDCEDDPQLEHVVIGRIVGSVLKE